jgi:hypothetical protein
MVTPKQVEVFGKAKEHTKLLFETDNVRLEAIAFFRLPTQFELEPKINQPCTLIAHVEQSYFMGRHQTRLRIVEVV